MRIHELLDEQKHSKLLRKYRSSIKHHPNANERSRSNSERLSDSELKELMGVNRDTYKRVNGKVKRK